MTFKKISVSLFAAFLLFSSSISFANDNTDPAHENHFSKKYSPEDRKLARKMFKNIVEDLNATYGLNLTPKEMCVLLKENMDQLQMPNYMKELLLDYIALLEATPRPKDFPKDPSE